MHGCVVKQETETERERDEIILLQLCMTGTNKILSIC